MADATEPCILLTGAEGFVGRWVGRELVARLGDSGRIVGTARIDGSPPTSRRIERVVLDVTDQAAVRTLVRAVKPTTVLHLAAIANVPEAEGNSRLTWDVNLFGTMNLAEAVRDETAGARFVFVGTADAYGDTFKTRSEPLDEDAPLAPTNTYSASKAAADLLVGEMAHHGLNAVRLRPFNHTGPGQSEAFVVPAFAGQIARIEAGLQPAILRVGNLDACRDFLDVRDVVKAYASALLEPDLPSGTVFNLASGRPTRIGDILATLLARANCPITVSPDPDRMRPSDTPLAVGSALKACDQLGWTATIPLDQTLADVLDHCRSELS